MATNNNEGGSGRGGDHASHEQHVKAGQQSRSGGSAGKSESTDNRGGSHEQHVKAGEQSHKNSGKSESGGGTQGGSSEQHSKAGQKSHQK